MGLLKIVIKKSSINSDIPINDMTQSSNFIFSVIHTLTTLFKMYSYLFSSTPHHPFIALFLLEHLLFFRNHIICLFCLSASFDYSVSSIGSGFVSVLFTAEYLAMKIKVITHQAFSMCWLIN